MNERKHNLDRQTGPELLRIIAMVLIMFHHFAVHGGIDYSSFSVNNAWLSIIEFGGKIGVNIFILITGYFSCSSKFSLKRVFRLLFAVECYSIVLMIVSVITGAQEIRIMLFVKGFLPLLFGNGYWFVSYYLILYILSPILNKGIEGLSKNSFRFTITFLIIVYSILPNTVGNIKPISEYGYSGLLWFIILYLLGAYFRKYSFVLMRHTALSGILLGGFVVVMLFARTIMLYYGDDYDGKLIKIIDVISQRNMNSLMPFGITVFAFCMFLPMKFKGNRLFFSVSKATFGVYLIHDNPMFSQYLWESVVHTKEMYTSQLFVLWTIISIVLLYSVCTLIEIIREKAIEKPLFSSRVVNDVIARIEKQIT